MQSEEDNNEFDPFEGADVADESSQVRDEESLPLLTRSRYEGGEPAEKGEGEGGEEGEAGEKKEEEEELEAGAKVGKMPAGDYTIHILVQNARQLIADGDDTCDPAVEFTVEGVNGKTTTKKDVTRSATVKFNEHVFLEVPGLT